MLHFLKRQAVLLFILLAFSLSGISQNKDEAIKPYTGKKPFRKFTVGVNAGALKSSVAVGGSNDFTNNKINFGYGINARYQLTHWLAFQADAIRGTFSGDQSKKQGRDSLNFYKPIDNFKTKLHIAGSLSAQLTFGNINWLNLKNYIVPYVSVGAGLALWNVRIKPKGEDWQDYQPMVHKYMQDLFIPVTLGMRYKLTPGINLDLNYRMNWVDGDNLDGFANYNVAPIHSSTVKKDKFSYTTLGIEFALGKKSKPQLLYDNPAYRASNFLQDQIDRLNNRVDSVIATQKGLEDTDNDGVADLYDKEPNTPAGCPVDAHGIMRDTDGDGVPDCQDKQLITPTECQPVDADGVGQCPEPECCKTLGTGNGNREDGVNGNCPSDFPSLNFQGKSHRLNADNKATLAALASKLKSNPGCNIVIKGYPETSKSSQAATQSRLDVIKNYLIEREGISSDRIITNSEVGGGDKNTINILAQ